MLIPADRMIEYDGCLLVKCNEATNLSLYCP